MRGRAGSRLSDELVRRLVATGQVDILVGVVCYDNAATITGILQRIQSGLRRAFPRERTLVLVVDGGSTDETAALARQALAATGDGTGATETLRTMHRISVPYHGVQGKAAGLRTVFTAAELLQARAVAVVDPDVVSLLPEWVPQLLMPVLRSEADFVAPVYARHPLEGPLVTQLVRPVVRALYGRRLHEPLAAEFAASAPYVSRALTQPLWDEEAVAEGIDLWLSLEALAHDDRCIEVRLGPRTVDGGRNRPGLPAVFAQVFGSLLHCLELHADAWRPRVESRELPIRGDALPVVAAGPALDATPLAESARAALGQLRPLFVGILPAELESEIHAAVDDPRHPQLGEACWVSAVHAFIAADRARVLPRQHLAQALAPIYLGRTATFIREHQGLPAELAHAALESLAQTFEHRRADVVARWESDARR